VLIIVHKGNIILLYKDQLKKLVNNAIRHAYNAKIMKINVWVVKTVPKYIMILHVMIIVQLINILIIALDHVNYVIMHVNSVMDNCIINV